MALDGLAGRVALLSVLHVIGVLLALFSAAFALPIGWSLASGDGMALVFAEPAAATAALGLLLAALTRRFRREVKPRESFLLVTLAWVLVPASAALPLMLGIADLSFTDAYFEAASGLTTTGATVLTGLDGLAPSLNLWRHALHWLGGMGIIVLALAFLPVLGVGGMQLYKAETPGPLKDEKLAPRARGIVKSVFLAYLVLTVAGVLALRLCGMSWFDAICHAFSVTALGGFSTHDASVAYFDSAAVESVLIVLMVIAALSFGRHYLALRRGSAAYRNYAEGKALLVTLLASVLGIWGLLEAAEVYPSTAASLRHVAFNVISIATTTGFVTQDYGQWPLFAPVWMIFLSCIACTTGSTGGGIKMFRTLVLQRQTAREVRLTLHPHAQVPLRIEARRIPDEVTHAVLGFIFLYAVTVIALTLALLLTHMDVVSAFTAIVASVNNLGPGLGQVGPATNFQSLTDLQTWICTLAMFLGRLEILGVLVLLSPTFWRY